MKVVTNKMDIVLTGFEEKYDVFFLKSKAYEDYAIASRRTSLLMEEWKNNLLSIYCQRAGNIYLMFEKHTVTLEDFQKLEELYSITINNIPYLDIKLNLLLNSLTKFQDETIINCTGHFYQLVRNKKNKRIYLEYRFFQGVLQQNVVTFTKIHTNNTKETIYYASGKNLSLIKKDSSTDMYIKKSYGRKNSIPFFNVKNIGKYQGTKVYYYSQIIKLFKNHLSDVMQIQSIEEDFKIEKWKKPNKIHIKKQALLNKVGIHIINSTDNLDCIEQLKYILNHSFEKGNISKDRITIGENLEESKINIQIVLPKEQYEEQGESDKYMSSQTVSIQHIYLDNLQNEYSTLYTAYSKTKHSSIGERIIFDGLIKYEIVNKIFGLAEIENVIIPKDWKYYMSVCDLKDKKKKYIFMLEFINNIPSFQEVNNDEIKKRFTSNSIQYCIEKSDHSFMFIKEDLKYHPFPNFIFVESLLEECEDFGLVKKEKVIEALELFNEKYHTHYIGKELLVFDEKIEIFKNNLKQIADKEIGRIDVLKVLKPDRKKPFLGRLFKQFYYEQYGKRIDTELSKNDVIEQYMRGHIHVNYKVNNTSIDYTVGKISEGAFKDSLSKTNRIRTVTHCNDEEFQRFMKMLCVDFVRVNQLTSIPFVFKYLREYALMNNRYLKI